VRARSVVVLVVALVAAACGGGSGGDESEATIAGETVVVDPDVVAQAQAAAEDEREEAAVASAAAADGETAGDASADEDEERIEVQEAEEDELDGLLNSVTVFTNCLNDDGFEFTGAPNQNGATAEDFEADYLAALGACATESDILGSLQSFGDAQANRTPEEIAAFNFGLPVFVECMRGLGWTVGDLVPDESGALGFDITGLTPPPGTAALDVDDVSICRLEAEQHVEANFDAES